MGGNVVTGTRVWIGALAGAPLMFAGPVFESRADEGGPYDHS
jgi:hypothetical protein